MKIEVAIGRPDIGTEKRFVTKVSDDLFYKIDISVQQEQAIDPHFISRIVDFIITKQTGLSFCFYALQDTNRILYYFSASFDYISEDIDKIYSLITAGINHVITGAQFNIISKL